MPECCWQCSFLLERSAAYTPIAHKPPANPPEPPFSARHPTMPAGLSTEAVLVETFEPGRSVAEFIRAPHPQNTQVGGWGAEGAQAVCSKPGDQPLASGHEAGGCLGLASTGCAS